MAARLEVIAAISLIFISIAVGKVYEKCELARELRDVHEIPQSQLATWVCIAQHESLLNTSAFNPGSGDHGLFQISQLFWCSPPGDGFACGVSCASLKDDDIEDDVICARRIYRAHQRISGDGFTAWTVYGTYCKDNPVSYIAGCFDESDLIRQDITTALSKAKTPSTSKNDLFEGVKLNVLSSPKLSRIVNYHPTFSKGLSKSEILATKPPFVSFHSWNQKGFIDNHLSFATNPFLKNLVYKAQKEYGTSVAEESPSEDQKKYISTKTPLREYGRNELSFATNPFLKHLISKTQKEYVDSTEMFTSPKPYQHTKKEYELITTTTNMPTSPKQSVGYDFASYFKKTTIPSLSMNSLLDKQAQFNNKGSTSTKEINNDLGVTKIYNKSTVYPQVYITPAYKFPSFSTSSPNLPETTTVTTYYKSTPLESITESSHTTTESAFAYWFKLINSAKSTSTTDSSAVGLSTPKYGTVVDKAVNLKFNRFGGVSSTTPRSSSTVENQASNFKPFKGSFSSTTSKSSTVTNLPFSFKPFTGNVISSTPKSSTVTNKGYFGSSIGDVTSTPPTISTVTNQVFSFKPPFAGISPTTLKSNTFPNQGYFGSVIGDVISTTHKSSTMENQAFDFKTRFGGVSSSTPKSSTRQKQGYFGSVTGDVISTTQKSSTMANQAFSFKTSFGGVSSSTPKSSTLTNQVYLGGVSLKTAKPSTVTHQGNLGSLFRSVNSTTPNTNKSFSSDSLKTSTKSLSNHQFRSLISEVRKSSILTHPPFTFRSSTGAISSTASKSIQTPKFKSFDYGISSTTPKLHHLSTIKPFTITSTSNPLFSTTSKASSAFFNLQQPTKPSFSSISAKNSLQATKVYSNVKIPNYSISVSSHGFKFVRTD